MLSDFIAIVSFIVAVLGSLAGMFLSHRDKQTMASIVAFAFLISFFVNINHDSRFILQGTCLTAFILAMVGGAVAIFSNVESKRTCAIVTGVISLGTSLLILFSYL